MQISSDAEAFGGKLLSPDAAAARIAAMLEPVARIEQVPLAACDGRVLAADVIAAIPLPPFDNSAVDGYAVRFADLVPSGETRLPVEGRITAGTDPAGIQAAGRAVRIFTGAPMPADADTVFMQEDVAFHEGRIVLPAGLKPGANRRLAGEDLAKGERALPTGRRLRPQDIALAAALGLTTLPVRARLRVAIFSTGDELAEPGTALPPAAIYDSNRALLASLLRRQGADVSDLGILRDTRAALAEALAAAAGSHDLVITSGGVSTGDEDHVKAAVEAAGALGFWRIAIKPGRPVAVGQLRRADGGTTPFVGLPGNPVAVFVTFTYVVRAMLAALAGAEPAPSPAIPARATFAYRKKEGRREYVRVSLHVSPDGTTEAAKYPREGAGVLTSLTETDGLMELAEPITRVEPGAVLPVFPYALIG